MKKIIVFMCVLYCVTLLGADRSGIHRVCSALSVSSLEVSGQGSQRRVAINIEEVVGAHEKVRSDEESSLLPHIEINRNQKSSWGKLKYGTCALATAAIMIGGWYAWKSVAGDESELRAGCDSAKQTCAELEEYLRFVNGELKPAICSVASDVCALVSAATCSAIEGWCVMNNGTNGNR